MYARIAQIFLKNRQLSLLLLITILILGFFSFVVTSKQYNPQITLPGFRIVTEFPGASANEVERLVTSEIENKLYEIPGVDETFSQSYDGGISVVSVLFKVGEDEEESKLKVTEKMRSNLDLSPAGVNLPIIKQINPENVAILTLAIYSDQIDADNLRDFAFDVRERLKTISGVTNIEVKGGRSKKFIIELDPMRMGLYGIALNDIANVLQANNISTPLGFIETNDQFLPVELDGNLDIGAVSNLNVSDNVMIKDFAEVYEGYDSITNYVRYTNKIEGYKNAVYLSFAKKKGENGVTVAEKIVDELENLKQNFVPEDINIEIVRNEGATAKEAIDGLTNNLITSIFIVTLILILFLRVRAAVIVAFAIPLTLSIVLLVGFLYGKSINRITLFSLILSLGLLVDSATVVVENIFRHLSELYSTDPEKNKAYANDEKNSVELKAKRIDAISNAVEEVGTGLLLSTVTSVIVFLPMFFITGMMGSYMGPIAFFVPAALIASMFVAVTLSPYLASVLLTSKAFVIKKSKKFKNREKWQIDMWYKDKILNILSSRWKQNIVLIVTFVLVVITFTFPVLELIHFKMLPTANKQQFYIYLDAPEGSSIQKTDEFAKRVENFLVSDPEVLSLQSYVGTSIVMDFNGLFKGADSRFNPNQATIKVNLTHPNDRKEKSDAIVQRLRPQIYDLFQYDPDLVIKLIENPPGPPVLSTLFVRIKGADDQMRENIARDLIGYFRNTEDVVDVDSTIASGLSKKQIVIDFDKMQSAGLSAGELAFALRTAIAGTDIATAHIDSQERSMINLRFDEWGRDDVFDVMQIQLRNQRGDLIPLSSVTRVLDSSVTPVIWHDEREVTTYVNSELSGRPVVYAVKDLIFDLLDYRLPGGTGILESWNLFGFTFVDQTSGEQYKIEWGGEFEMTLENFRDLGLAMFVAFFFIYVVLVAQFKSFKTPVLIMTSIVLAFGGVMPGFAILDMFGIPFTATSMIGLIALGGIVVNNSIILLEFMQQLRDRGIDLKMAITLAAQTRFRPIVLTSLTTILGSLTIASDPVWSGLAWAIVFGLSLSTVLTLLVFPVLYYRVEG